MKELVSQANKIYKENFNEDVFFERAIFFSWYCGLGDCTFCYMSTQKDKIKDPKKSRRSISSILSEVIISKAFDWELEFLSGGYDSYSKEELLFLIKNIYNVTGKKQWLNIGTLSKEELKLFQPYVEGYAGTIEIVNWKIRKKVCPSKKIEPILNTFKYCDELGLKKAMTLIIGLGETIEDFENLNKFIEENKISKITFYALNPHPGTEFKKSPELEYYISWIAKTRIAFPKIHIIAGAWVDKIDYYSQVLDAGANSITKLPAMKVFNTKNAKLLKEQIEKANRKFKSKFYCKNIDSIDWNSYIERLKTDDMRKKEIKNNLQSYLNKLKNNLKTHSLQK